MQRMFESLTLVKSLYQDKAYSIEDMIKKVDDNIITKQQFFDITRMYYEPLKKKYSK